MPRLYIQFIIPILEVAGVSFVGWQIGQTIPGLIIGLVGGLIIGLLLAHHARRRLAAVSQTLDEQSADHGILASSSETTDEINQLAGTISHFIEIERAKAETERQEHARQFQLLDRMHDGVMRTDAEGVITYANVAAGAIFGGRNPVQRSFLAVTHDHELNLVLATCLNTGVEQQLTVDIPIGNRVINAVIVRINDSPPEALVVLRDITELTRLQTLRRDFVANVSHELRTPLSTIKILTETSINLSSDSEQQNFLHKIDYEVDAMTELVDELLLLARLQSRAPDLTLSIVEIPTLFEHIRERTLPLFEQHQLQLVVQNPESEDLTIEVDERRILQAMLNLVHNAIHHTPPGGTVTLSAVACDGMVQLAVTDTGIGLMPDDLGRIWERFYKADRSRSKSGSGLGLAIVKYITQAHGGDVQATSEPGKGSIFMISIPVRQSQ